MAVKNNNEKKNKKKPVYNTKKNNKTTSNSKNSKSMKKKGSSVKSNQKTTKNKNNNKKNNIKNSNKSKTSKKATYYKKSTNTNKKSNKVKNVKRSVIVKKVDTNISDAEILEKILEESKLKKLNRKKTLANKNQVKSKVVIDILKEDSKNVEKPIVKEVKDTSKKEKTEKEDLIITREIDLADLDEYLTRESQIIEDNIDEELSKETEEEEKLVITEPEKKKKKEKETKKSDLEPSMRELVDLSKGGSGISISIWNVIILILLLILLIVVIIVGTKTFAGSNKGISPIKKVFVDKKALAAEKDREREEKAALYKECLAKEKNEFDTNLEIENYVKDLNDYFASKYRVSIKYVDINHQFEYSYNSDKVYYAASTIKALDGLYIYSKAASGEINLDETMTYTSKYNLASSFYMTKHKYGDKISLRDLVRYAITRSDNRAHQMLIDYISVKKLKEFGLSLGATKTLVGDIFGSINVDDAIVYWREINKFINSNEELGNELKSYFKEADQNYLNIESENVSAIHKYGEYENYYHDIGIVYADNPYIIAILSTEGYSKYEEMIKDINSKIFELNKLYISNREKVCHNDVYK